MPEIPAVPALWRFPAHPVSVGRARRAVAEALPCGLPPQLGAELGLITSELVTNAVRYGACRDDVVELRPLVIGAVGRDGPAARTPAEASPISGALLGSPGNSHLAVTVKVHLVSEEETLQAA